MASLLNDHDHDGGAVKDDDDSSAHTSAAAVDSDDASRMDDAIFHTDHDDSDTYSDFCVDQQSRMKQDRFKAMRDDTNDRGTITMSRAFPDGVTSPPSAVTIGYDSLADLNHERGLSSSAVAAVSSGSTPTKQLLSSQELGRGICGSAPAYDVGQIGGGGRAPLGPPLSREEQHAMMKELMLDKESRQMKPGQTRYLISLRWMRRWNDYVGWNQYNLRTAARPVTNESPGPITNEDILTPDGSKLKAFQSSALECVTKQRWDLLSGWYGGVAIERPVIMCSGSPTVEIYPLELRLETGPENSRRSADIVISKGSTVGDLRQRGIGLLKLEDVASGDLHVWEITASFKYRELSDDLQVLSDLLLSNKAAVLFEVEGDTGDDCEANNLLTDGATTMNIPLSTASVWRSDYFSSSRRSATPGAVGLNNLGNTCFMNAAIQCLSHIPQVRDYFGGKGGRQPFREDINLDNPLGTRGELARAFGDLVKRMWEGRETCIYPRDFREVLCNHARQFLGYDQHDSQEFLAYLLDGIHEDVNRVREKPYVEKVEAKGGEGDEMAARRAWDAHLERNDSFVVDTMHGQYKSVVTCPVEGCNRTSTTFDPAMYLSVPLPTASDKHIEVILATLDGYPPKRYCLGVPKNGRVKNLRQALSKACGVREDRLMLADIWQYNVQTLLKDDTSVSTIRKDDTIVGYQLPKWGPRPPPPSYGCHCCEGGSNSRSSSIGGKPGTIDGASTRGGGLFAEGGGFGAGVRDGGARAVGWVPKLSPFFLTGRRSEELRNGGDAEGRFYLLQSATTYLDRFPPQEDLAGLESKRDSESSRENAADHDDAASSPTKQSEKTSLDECLRKASEHPCSFMELETPKAVVAFGEAVSSLRELVVHEQREVKVQITQVRPSEYDKYGSGYSRVYGSYNGRGTPFSFPLLLSYLPHSTTVGEFRAIVALLLRRHVLPHDANEQDDSMDLNPSSERRPVASGDETLTSNSLNETPSKLGPGDPGNILRLMRSGELQLLTKPPLLRQSVNIFAGGDERADELLSDWMEEPGYGMPELELRWSADALREAFGAAEAQQVEDHGSVAESRDRALTPLSVRECIEHFLQREQLDETEMWYCSSCKEHRRAYKELSLWRLPPVLIVHLKRFSYDTMGGWSASREKIDNLVTFPVRGLDMRDLERSRAGGAAAIHGTKTTNFIDPTADQSVKSSNSTKSTSSSMGGSTAGSRDDCPLEDWVVVSPQQQQRQAAQCDVVGSAKLGGSGQGDNDPVHDDRKKVESGLSRGPESSDAQPGATEDDGALYDLWGVVNHYGGLGGGHYTAFARDELNDQWYDMSDDRVSEVESESELVTSAAYVLFYQRRGAKALKGAYSAGSQSPVGNELLGSRNLVAGSCVQETISSRTGNGDVDMPAFSSQNGDQSKGCSVVEQ